MALKALSRADTHHTEIKFALSAGDPLAHIRPLPNSRSHLSRSFAAASSTIENHHTQGRAQPFAYVLIPRLPIPVALTRLQSSRPQRLQCLPSIFSNVGCSQRIGSARRPPWDREAAPTLVGWSRTRPTTQDRFHVARASDRVGRVFPGRTELDTCWGAFLHDVLDQARSR